MPADIGQNMQQLYSQFGDLPGVAIELHKELLAINISNQQAEATVFLQGAQLSHYQRHGEKPVIWFSELNSFQEGQSQRGGIPICWPWFGDLDRNEQIVQESIKYQSSQTFPAHGFIRSRLWQVDDIVIVNKDCTKLFLSFSMEKDQEAFWPYACNLRLVVTVSDQLTMQFEVQNTSDQTLHFSCALHSYFHVENIAQTSIEGLDQLEYVDCLDDWGNKTQQGTLIIDREIDRIYHGTQQALSINDGELRTIKLQSQGSNSAVVWNPWIEKSKRLSNFDDQAYQGMLCIETSNAQKDFVELAANKTHTIEVLISTQQ